MPGRRSSRRPRTALAAPLDRPGGRDGVPFQRRPHRTANDRARHQLARRSRPGHRVLSLGHQRLHLWRRRHVPGRVVASLARDGRARLANPPAEAVGQTTSRPRVRPRRSAVGRWRPGRQARGACRSAVFKARTIQPPRSDGPKATRAAPKERPSILEIASKTRTRLPTSASVSRDADAGAAVAG